MPARRKRVLEEEHVNHERWLITYADMITLLMVLFIVLFAISQIDQKRFEMLRDGMAAGFGQTPSPFQGTQATVADGSVSPVTPVAPIRVDLGADDEDPDSRRVAEAALRLDQDRRARIHAEAAAEVRRLERVRRRLLAALRKEGLASDVRMRIDEQGLRVSLVSRHVVFAPNVATLTQRGRRIVDTVAPVLRALPDPLQVDGHTNQVPVRPKFYATDWDLSAARAVTVLRRLDEHGRIPEQRLAASAYGHTRPLIPPDRPIARKLNKRVDIVVLSSAAAEVRAVLPQVRPSRRS